jgi:DNA-binding CsgD family transcriptional regulator
MTTSEDVLRLVGGIYDAALEPPRWPSVLEQLANLLHGTLTAIFVHDFRTHDGGAVWATRWDPHFVRQYTEYYHARNIYVTANPAVVTLGRVLTSEQLCPETAVLRSEIHADWMSPQDIFWTIGAPVLQEDSASAIVTSMRPHRAPPFGRDDVALQRLLVPHFQRALQLQRRLQTVEAVGADAMAALERLTIGVILLDERAVPFAMNAAAQRILRSGDGLAMSREGVLAVAAADTTRLQRAIRDARAATSEVTSNGGALRLIRPSGRRPLEILVTPLPAGRIAVGQKAARVAVFVSDPEAEARASDAGETLRQLYGLTAGEARLLTCLLDGMDLTGAADVLGRSVHTVRTQTKAILAKTGTSRQADLLRLILGGPANLASLPSDR